MAERLKIKFLIKNLTVKYSREVLKNFNNAKKKLIIIRNGDHSLSSKKNLNIICKQLKLIIKKVS